MTTSSFASTGLAADCILRHHLRPGDLGQILFLHGTLRARDYGFDPLFEAHIAGSLAEFVGTAEAADRLWIAENEGRLAGCIALVGLSPKDAELRWFLVDPSANVAGLDRRLLQEAIAFGEERGYECLFQWTVREQETARFYRSFGFEKVQEKVSARGGIPVVAEQYVLHPSGRPT